MPPKKKPVVKKTKKKNEPIASNVNTQIFSKIEEEEEPEPASLYYDDYAEYKEDDIDTDTESIISQESSVGVKEDNICLDDEEYNNQYSFISKVNQNIKICKNKKLQHQLFFDEYEEES